MEDHTGLGDVATAQAQPEMIRDTLVQAAIAAHNHHCPHCYPNTVYGQGDTGCAGFNEIDLGVAATVLTSLLDSLKTALTSQIWSAVEKVRFTGEPQ